MTYFWCARHNMAEKAGFDTGECLLTGPYSTKAQAEEFGKLPKSSEQPCQTCNDDPAVCATVPGLRHCEKAMREHNNAAPQAPAESGVLNRPAVAAPSEKHSEGFEALFKRSFAELEKHPTPRTEKLAQEVRNGLATYAIGPHTAAQHYYDLARQLERELRHVSAMLKQAEGELEKANRMLNSARINYARETHDRIAAQSATGESVPNAIRHDAMRWRALFECSRIRVLGYARGGPKGRDGPIRHIGFEWTTDQEPYCDTELLDGKERLVEFTDAILNASADNGAKK